MNLKIKLGNFLFKYRSFTPVPLIIIVFLFFTPVNYGDLNIYINLTGFIFAVTGESIRVLSVGYSFTGTSGRENYLRADNLNTSGIYSIVRNPLYIGNLFIYSGLLIIFSNFYALLFFDVFLIIQYYFITLSEQEFLKSQYGEEYRDYCNKVKSVIPGFKYRRKAENKFDLKKVIFKENDSVFNSMFLIGLLMLYKEKTFFAIKYPVFWKIYFPSIIILYIFIKILKRRK